MGSGGALVLPVETRGWQRDYYPDWDPAWDEYRRLAEERRAEEKGDPVAGHSTDRVRQIAHMIRSLTAGELIALREELRGYFDMPDDEGGAGVREPRQPYPPLNPLRGLGATAEKEDD